MNLLVLLLFCALCGMAVALGSAGRRLRLQERGIGGGGRPVSGCILGRREGGF